MKKEINSKTFQIINDLLHDKSNDMQLQDYQKLAHILYALKILYINKFSFKENSITTMPFTITHENENIKNIHNISIWNNIKDLWKKQE